MIPEIGAGTLITNRYLIQKTLGQGGFGRTYLAMDTQRFSEPCVLKEFVPATTNAGVLSKSRELFEREAKVLYQIQHPQVPQFLASLSENQRLFIVQEYIDGKTYSQILSTRLQGKGKPFCEAEVRAWLLDLLPVLEYIHERKIIHRDISLENVMVRRGEFKPMLIDFGVVKEKLTQIFSANPVQGSVVGKIGYSPPEQLRLGQCYPCSDIYALGVSALVLLTGKMPYMLMDESLNWRWRSHAKVSDSLASILQKMLCEAPSERYQTAREVLVELNQSHQPQSISRGMFANLLPKASPAKVTQEQEKQISQNLTSKSTGNFSAQTPVSLNPEFLEYVQRELTSFVGPFASFVIKQALQQTPQIAPEEFIAALAAAVPDAQRAEEFKGRITLSLAPSSPSLQNATQLQSSLGDSPAISNPEFLEHCRRELISFVGPFASVVLKDTLDQNPNLTPKQLVETLVAEIPNPQRAQEFKGRLEKLNLG
jgi:serine/threonine-protein kinase